MSRLARAFFCGYRKPGVIFVVLVSSVVSLSHTFGGVRISRDLRVLNKGAYSILEGILSPWRDETGYVQPGGLWYKGDAGRVVFLMIRR